jgi:dihydrofolate synthase/folylpolyglutamate synthase
MAPIVTHWYFCDLPTDRAIKALDLQNMWLKCSSSTEKSNSSISASVKTQTFPGPVQAPNDAIANANPADRIVVFGSFYTVGGVLEHGIPRLSAPHLQSPASPPTIQVGLQSLG